MKSSIRQEVLRNAINVASFLVSETSFTHNHKYAE